MANEPEAIELLEIFVRTPHQRFVCSLAGPSETDRRQTFSVEHRLREPASTDLLEEFRGCPAATQVVDFYTWHDGGILFRDPDSDAAGLELLKSSTWPLLRAAIRETYNFFPADDRPEWLDHFLAFSEVLHSGNYFIVPTAGPDAGKVIYCDQEGPTATVWARNFETFIAQIIEDPAEQIDRMGCFLRFRRGDEQWVPERFFSGDEIAW